MEKSKLFKARKEKGYTQQQIANIIGCRKSTVSNWETGYSIPRLHDAIALSIILEKDLSELFFDEIVQISCTLNKRKYKMLA